MSSYYQFHSQQAHDQINDRMQEAANHRLAHQGEGSSSFRNLFRLVFPLLIGAFVVLILLNGCTPDITSTENTSNRVDTSSGPSMGERIHFQDARETFYEVNTTTVAPNVPTMAQRIEFQDYRDAGPAEIKTAESNPTWTVTSRYQFQDRVQDR